MSIAVVVIGHWTIALISWGERPLWLAVSGALLAGLVAVFGRIEQSRPRSSA